MPSVVRAQIHWQTGVALAGAKDGSNRVYTAPEPFWYFPPEDAPRVTRNGVVQTDIDDYTVSESIPGAGYNTITFVPATPAPLAWEHLTIDYRIG
jgi:hypothetical protein